LAGPLGQPNRPAHQLWPHQRSACLRAGWHAPHRRSPWLKCPSAAGHAGTAMVAASQTWAWPIYQPAPVYGFRKRSTKVGQCACYAVNVVEIQMSNAVNSHTNVHR